MNIDTTKYINIPYKAHGRDFSGCDCYGLVLLFYKEEYGIILEDFHEYTLGTGMETVAKLINDYQPLVAGTQVEIPQIGDLCLFKFRGLGSHVGIYIGKDMVLHVLGKTNVTCEPISRGRMKGRLDGYYSVK